MSTFNENFHMRLSRYGEEGKTPDLEVFFPHRGTASAEDNLKMMAEWIGQHFHPYIAPWRMVVCPCPPSMALFEASFNYSLATLEAKK